MRSMAQVTSRPSTVAGWADRLSRFGRAIPQEKVFVHMDNTCYFLGDTIWFAAYTRRTDVDHPSTLSGVLYVELLNQEGYLVERQIVEMRGGRGQGCFALADTLYGGFYELRAYTRWQLNWGLTEKEHTSYAEQWFFSKDLAKEYYRDYEKLYSRVFPVYDAPKQPGEYFHDMTTRPLRRYFKSGAESAQLTLSLFPEGGSATAGLPCNVAFEAVSETGEWQTGKLELFSQGQVVQLRTSDGSTATAVDAVSRGRGLFSFTPESGQKYKARFTTSGGVTAETTLAVNEADGVSLSVRRQADDYVVDIYSAGAAARELGLTLMHEGRVERFETIAAVNSTSSGTVSLASEPRATFSLPASSLVPGVHQLTLFDADGRVWADRLFFVTSSSLGQPTLKIDGIKDHYEPYEQATLELSATLPSMSEAEGRAASATTLSVAVRDAGTSDLTYDTSDILSEMLLSSEIRGYVPDPRYFFEADDAEHRTALDLLMLTQGWRRFAWHTMATPGAFELKQPVEAQTPIFRGQVLKFKTGLPQNDVEQFDVVSNPYEYEESVYRLEIGAERAFINGLSDGSPSPADIYEDAGLGEILETIKAEARAKERHLTAGSYQMHSPIASSRYAANEGELPHEMRVHAEFTQPHSESIVGDVDTQHGHFTIQSPRFTGYCVFFLAASDTLKWKSGHHTWIDMDDSKEPEFYVRISWPYPRFTQPYSHYQTSYREAPAFTPQAAQTSLFNPKTFETQMGGLTVMARRGGLRTFDASHPAIVVDAYEAFNETCDAGLASGWYRGRIHFINNIARTYIGDMNTTHAYLLEPRYDGRNISFNRPAATINRYNLLTNLDSVRIYTDFKPRYGADPRVTEDNLDRVGVDLRLLPDEGQRVSYRDRRYVLQGFNEIEDFYSPDYSRARPSADAADYRRTLYWNPALPLDADGHATVRFFTGTRPATLSVEANGQANDGTLLHVNTSNP